ncbi:Hpt domain-containing response regulator [Algoriphagus namhaensis]
MANKKILIIEGELLHQKIFTNLLGKSYSLNICTSLAEASQYLESHSPDMMIMDIHTAGFDGKSCLEQPNLTIPVLASSSSLIMKPSQFRELGFSGFIQKPISAKKLLQIIAQAFSETPQQLRTKPKEEILNLTVVRGLLKFNSAQRLLAIFDDFFVEASEAMLSIEKAFCSHEIQIIIDNLHILKGNSGTLGASKLHRVLTSAQDFARKGNIEQARNLIPEIQEEIQKLKVYIAQPNLFENE